MAHRRRRRVSMAYVRSFRKTHRRRHRRNPIPVGGFVANRRRRYRRNPISMGSFKSMVPALQPVLYAGAGFVGAHALEYFLTTPGTNADGTQSAPLIPTTITGSSIGKYAVRIGCVIATAYLAKLALGGDKAKQVGIGGGVYVLTSAAKEFAPVSISPYLAAYRPNARLGSYVPNRQLGAARVQPFGGSGVVSLGAAKPRFNRFG